MTEPEIYDSAPSQPDDDFWLQQGRKMVQDSLPAIRNAAAHLITGIWALEGIYLGILSFGRKTTDATPVAMKMLLIVPLLLWIVALFGSVEVMKTRRLQINLHSPDDIATQNAMVLTEKQRLLNWTVTIFAVGVFLAFGLVLFYLQG